MRLAGKIYDFGDGQPSEHLRAISEELEEQAFINGEDYPGIAHGHRPLNDLSELLKSLAAEVESMQRRA